MSGRGMTGHQRPHQGISSDWLTPPEFLEALGPFDLDPCASEDQPWPTASRHITLPTDGLAESWSGFVWCNPPFGPHATVWLARMADHNNGIALVPARTETRSFVQNVWGRATSILFLYRRPHFHSPVTGERAPANSGVPICLIAYGPLAAERLRHSGLSGALVQMWTPQ